MRRYSPSREIISKCGSMKRLSRAVWMEWMVALLPEPWKARMLGLMYMLPLFWGDWGVLLVLGVVDIGVGVDMVC